MGNKVKGEKEKKESTNISDLGRNREGREQLDPGITGSWMLLGYMIPRQLQTG